MKTSSVLSALFATAASASPTRVLGKRETTWCDSYGSTESDGYTIYHNNWGAAQATSGSQCTTFDSVTSGSVTWSTSWTWAGGSSSVKSYSNVALVDVDTQLSAISSIPSKWTWSYTGTDIVADVAYDLWLAPSASADNEYEIMVWLAAYGGAGPISSTGSPVDSPTIAGYEWSLYSGTNGDTTVFSFVATNNITSFDGDLNEFFTYLTTNQGVSTSMYATSLQAGTEPFTGTDAVFDTTAYSISVDTSGSSGSSSSVIPATSATSVAAVSSATSVVPVVTSAASSLTTLETRITSVASVPQITSAVSAPVVVSETVEPSAPSAVLETPVASAPVIISATPVSSVASAIATSAPTKKKCHA